MFGFNSFERTQIMGRLGNDAETKFTPKGTAVTSFNVAVDKYDYKSKQRVTEWKRVVAFGEQFQKMAQYLTKGCIVFVDGEPNTETWEKDGEQHSAIKISANSIVVVGGKKDSNASEPAHNAAAPAASAPTAQQPAADLDDDVPF